MPADARAADLRARLGGRAVAPRAATQTGEQGRCPRHRYAWGACPHAPWTRVLLASSDARRAVLSSKNDAKHEERFAARSTSSPSASTPLPLRSPPPRPRWRRRTARSQRSAASSTRGTETRWRSSRRKRASGRRSASASFSNELSNRSHRGRSAPKQTERLAAKVGDRRGLTPSRRRVDRPRRASRRREGRAGLDRKRLDLPLAAGPTLDDGLRSSRSSFISAAALDTKTELGRQGTELAR